MDELGFGVRANKQRHKGQSSQNSTEPVLPSISPLLVDFVLSRFMRRDDWIEMCRVQGFGVNSDHAWSNAEPIASLPPQIELAHGGDNMVFCHFGSDSRDTRLVEAVGGDPLLASLAYLPSRARWLRRYRRWRTALELPVDAPS